jgi:hypothetical protein
MQDLTLQLFEPQVGSTFQIMINGEPALELNLVEVNDLTIKDDPLRDPTLRSQPFELLFHGPLTPIAEQMNYELSHSELGQLAIFLVPLGPDQPARQHMRYQAVFN